MIIKERARNNLSNSLVFLSIFGAAETVT